MRSLNSTYIWNFNGVTREWKITCYNKVPVAGIFNVVILCLRIHSSCFNIFSWVSDLPKIINTHIHTLANENICVALTHPVYIFLVIMYYFYKLCDLYFRICYSYISCVYSLNILLNILFSYFMQEHSI